MNKHLVHPDFGTVKLAKREGSIVKRALLCRTGSFMGMNGPVEVTPEMLQGICDRYRQEKSKPQNDNDYAPILVDHVRLVENVMGRVLAEGMEVASWINPADGEEYDGLYGDLRVDDQDALEHVKSGKFSQLSISFDEDTHEFFEVSFVAVPAAKGSILLSKGGKKVSSYQKKFATMTQKHNALAAAAKKGLESRKVILSRMTKTKTSLVKEATALAASIAKVDETIKIAQLKSRFSEFVRQGRITPAELKELDFKSFAALAAPAVDAIAKAYAGRPVSHDVYTFGQTSEEISLGDGESSLSPKKMREAIELQRSGKPGATIVLAADGKKPDGTLAGDDKDDEKLGEEDDKKQVVPSLGAEDWKQCMEHLADAHGKLTACLEKIKSFSGEADKLADADKDEEKKLGEDDDSSDMGADDEDDKKLGDDDDKEKLAGDDKEDEKLGADDDKKEEGK